VKLLFDENLSARLIADFAAEFPGSTHVHTVGLAGATDLAVWTYARDQACTLISKDDDFRHLSLVRGAPPKVIVLRVGNASTDQVEAFLRGRLLWIKNFELSAQESLLVLS
jgi:predicted nuclease of predicted toxin-antitoxin system